MAYSDAVLQRAKARLAQERENAEQESQARIAEIYAGYPRLREIDLALRATVARVLAASFRRGEDPAEAVEQAKKENLALQEERSWILQANDLKESDLEVQPVCVLCGGSGYVGGRMCECLCELCRQEQKRELSSLLAGRETFESFRLQYYPVEPDEELGVSPRKLMERVYQRCRTYARTFGPGAASLLFTGGTGLGKTFLSACIARTVAENGWSVVYDTSARLFADFETAKFGTQDGENQNLTRKYLQCDLLIIDDLGTEMLTQFVQSALYQVVNTRLMEGHATIISTNLSTKELSGRYMKQTVSRLLGVYELFMFRGNDIRMLKK